MRKILIIQTAFIGDVILSTALIEAISTEFPNDKIYFLLRKGNETLLINNPHIQEVYVWNKNKKIRSFFEILSKIKKMDFDLVINVQRFFFSGLFTVLSGAKNTVGFNKNPLSFLFSNKVNHEIGNNSHEIERNFELIKGLSENIKLKKPKLYLTSINLSFQKAETFITISPSSVWFTKQYPKEKWIDFLNSLNESFTVYILGGKSDVVFCNEIKDKTSHQKIEVLAGKLSFLESAELMKFAVMNFVNDSAPLHMATAVNAPVTALFCSTIPEFGFTPLSDISHIIQVSEKLSCRPCGLHGKKECPEGNFKCGFDIDTQLLLNTLPK